MKTIEEIRIENLGKLRDGFGSVAAFAKVLDRSESQVSQWLNASINSGTGKPRGMRPTTARWIEGICQHPPGWLDTDHGDGTPPQAPVLGLSLAPQESDADILRVTTLMGECTTAQRHALRWMVEAQLEQWRPSDDFQDAAGQ